MPATTLFIISALMLGVGGGLIYLIMRRRASSGSQGALAWIGMVVSLLFILVGAGLSMVALSSQVDVALLAQSRSVVGKPAPPLQFRLVDSNEKKSLADYEGKVVLLNLWATWCPPCLKEMHELNRIQATYGDEGVVVITISDEPRQSIMKFEREQIELKTVSAYLPDALSWPAPYSRVKAARPTSFLIDREGIIRRTWPGAKNYAFFAWVLRPYL